MRQTSSSLLLSLSFVLFSQLAGCGGGGGGDSGSIATSTTTGAGGGGSVPTTSATAYDLRTAWINSVNDTRTFGFTAQGTVGGQAVTGSGTQEQGALMNATNPQGAAAREKLITIRMTLTNAATGQTSSTTGTEGDWFSGSDLVLTGIGLYNTGTLNQVPWTDVLNFMPLPTAAHVGDSGQFYTTRSFDDQTTRNLTSTGVVSWRLDAGTGDEARLVVTSTRAPVTGEAADVGVSTYGVSTLGAIRPISIATSIPRQNSNLAITYNSF